MIKIRTTIAILMAFVLIGTAQQMALARGQASASGEIILCQGGVAVAVAVDQYGKPVGKRHICPDCAAHFFAAVGVPATDFAPDPRGRSADFIGLTVAAHMGLPREAQARDPPFQSDFT